MEFNSAFKGLSNVSLFLISNFRRVLNVVCFLLDNSPAYEFYMPTFRNETSAYKIQTPRNYPEESIQHNVFSCVTCKLR